MQSALLDRRRFPTCAAVLLAGASGWLWLIALQPCEGGEFRVEGTLTTTTDTHVVMSGTNAMDVETGTFALSTSSSSQWLIQVRKDQWTVDEIDVGRDGGPVYEYELLESNSQSHAAKTGRRPLNNGIATLRPGPVGDPIHCEEATTLWWAFLSNSYLEEKERAGASKLPIIFTTDERLRFFDTAMPSRWRRFSEPPFLPEALDQENEGFDYQWRDYDNGPYVMPPSKAHYAGLAGKGFTNVVYRVDETSTFAGLLLPARFHLDYYMPEGTPRKPAARACSLWKSFSFVVTNRSTEVGAQSFIPEVRGITLVDDFRFAPSQPRVLKVGYFATNRWLAEAEVKNLPEYGQTLRYQDGARARLQGPRRTSLVSKALFWSSFMGSIWICLWLLWRRRQGHEMPIEK
jgi:hypothetical protein